MERMRHARSREEVYEIKKRIEEAHAQIGREIRKVEGVRWDGVVRWGPGGDGEDGISCEFEDSLECSETGSEFFCL